MNRPLQPLASPLEAAVPAETPALPPEERLPAPPREPAACTAGVLEGRLPESGPQHPKPGDGSANQAKTGLLAAASLRLLLVEDDVATAAALAEQLAAMGHRVTVAGTVAAALAAAAREGFDLVVSDIGLPDGNGHQLMRELAGRYRLRGIAVSGYGMEEDRRRSLAAGFSCHLTKPVSMRRLHEAIEQAAAATGD